MEESGIVCCERCGKPLNIGDFPFCPHGSSSRVMIERDEIPGGIVLENYGAKPIRFDSHSERRAYMKAHGLEEKERFVPYPGTDRDPAGIPNPLGYMDDYTRESARVLLERRFKVGQKSETTGVLVNVTTGEMSEEEVRRATR